MDSRAGIPLWGILVLTTENTRLSTLYILDPPKMLTDLNSWYVSTRLGTLTWQLHSPRLYYRFSRDVFQEHFFKLVLVPHTTNRIYRVAHFFISHLKYKQNLHILGGWCKHMLQIPRNHTGLQTVNLFGEHKDLK